MPLFLYRPFKKLSVGCASALLLFATSTVTKVQAHDFEHDIAFTFNLSTKDHFSDSDSGKLDGDKSDWDKSDHDSFDFSVGKCGGSFGSDSDWGGDKGHHHDEFFAFAWKEKDRNHDSGEHGFGNCPPPDPSCWNWNQGGSGCSGGDPNGGGSPAAPEPGTKYLSLIAAGAMALLLVRRGFRQGTPARRG